jgi:hypothetical protein
MSPMATNCASSRVTIAAPETNTPASLWITVFYFHLRNSEAEHVFFRISQDGIRVLVSSPKCLCLLHGGTNQVLRKLLASSSEQEPEAREPVAELARVIAVKARLSQLSRRSKPRAPEFTRVDFLKRWTAQSHCWTDSHAAPSRSRCPSVYSQLSPLDAVESVAPSTISLLPTPIVCLTPLPSAP